MAVTTERKLAGILGLSGRLAMVGKAAEVRSTLFRLFCDRPCKKIS